ncbi:MAG: bifunctional folylpolyglutamate synthase/dihydrofolate synthase [Oscillospiraceae bacterium]|nr:bifunctional folylpolyglutamate synthase/dihydrofolate synthase [Oscillospiraceae bacterium]
MTAEEAISFIHERAWRGSKPGLARTRALLAEMGDPQKRLRFIHVAGTNGKGSVSAMLASILQSAGFRTGLYTSPYLTSFNERMRVNGEPISGGELAELTAAIAPCARALADRPTEFELVTALAFSYFERQGCDAVVLETGLGGRLDSTNVIEAPVCSVITNIGLDHTRELGDTVEKIAAEKAGIIKRDRPAVIYDLPEAVTAVLAARCRAAGSRLIRADFSKVRPVSDSLEGQVFSYGGAAALRLPLLGAHQLKNAALAIETVKVLRENGFDISSEAVRRGFAHTVWPARFELISRKPWFVVDGGHNPQCAETVAENLLHYFPDQKRISLFGVLADKDYMRQAAILDTAADAFVTITPPSPRALPADTLARRLRVFGKPVFSGGSISEGIETALSLAGENGVVCSVGSLYSAGPVRAYFGK